MIVNVAPAPARAVAIAAPMPRLPPVTMACVPTSVLAKFVRLCPLEQPLQLLLARIVLRRPLLFAPAHLRRRPQRPVRVTQMRPAERYEIRSARRDDRIHLIDVRDVSHCDGRDSGFVADPVTEWRLEHPAVYRFGFR